MLGNNLIKGRWKIIKKIGAGAFGEIYIGHNIVTSEQVAVKVERADSKKQVLRLEVAVLKKLQSCSFVPRFITCGRVSDYNYLVMELLGENLSDVRRRQPKGVFSMITTLKLGIMFLKIIEIIHDLGYLHRDIKPSNFVLGLEKNKSNVYIIDFGLARKFVDPDGEVRSARDQSGFRGTARYASINSHLSRDLGRRDDVWSVLYILVEFAKGYLPWRKLKEKEEIRDMKIKFNTPELVADLPTEFSQIMDYLLTLEFSDRPDYDYIIELLQKRLVKLGGDEHSPFDWEINDQNTKQQTSITSYSGEDDEKVYKLVANDRRNNRSLDENVSSISREEYEEIDPIDGNVEENGHGRVKDDTKVNQTSKNQNDKQTMNCKCIIM